MASVGIGVEDGPVPPTWGLDAGGKRWEHALLGLDDSWRIGRGAAAFSAFSVVGLEVGAPW